MDYLSTIRRPIETELEQFNTLFSEALSSDSALLTEVLQHITQRAGKRMRPILVLLIAKAFGEISLVTQNAALGLELLHTASLVHDDVVDEAYTRRGQASVNALFDNRVSVLVGDFILATALLRISHTRNNRIVAALAEVGRTLAGGELQQLSMISSRELSEERYFEVIKKKTAAMFATCATLGAMSVEMPDETVEKCKTFGENLGIAFQIRDDIFDYFPNQDIGKPTFNDMEEGKLTLPVIFAVNKAAEGKFFDLAMRVRQQTATKEEITTLVQFTKDNGGIEYAERWIKHYQSEALAFISQHITSPEISTALTTYVDYVVGRKL